MSPPSLCAGTWVTFGPGVTEAEAESVVVLAYESGVNLFDISEAHCGPRAEVELGRILQRRAWKRASYVVCTKIYWNTKYVHVECEIRRYKMPRILTHRLPGQVRRARVVTEAYH